MNEDEEMSGHKFPKSILNAINENSGGGYFLVVMDESKNLRFYTESDDAVGRRGMLDFADTIVEKLRFLDDEEIDHALMVSMHPDLEDQFFIDPDDDEDDDTYELE